MRAIAAALLLATVGLSGCSEAPAEARLPGVFTHSEVRDDFRCGALLFAAGCPIVRIPSVDSGCAPEVPGYVACNATVTWSVTAGAAAPQSRLTVTVNGTDAGSCVASPGAVCRIDGNATFTHHFQAPGQGQWWNVTIAARLEAPGQPEAATGEFMLSVRMRVHTQEASATDVDA